MEENLRNRQRGRGSPDKEGGSSSRYGMIIPAKSNLEADVKHRVGTKVANIGSTLTNDRPRFAGNTWTSNIGKGTPVRVPTLYYLVRLFASRASGFRWFWML